MTIKKLANGRWQARVYLTPQLKPLKTFATKLEAQTWFYQQKEQFRQDPLDLVRRRDRRRLSTLVDLWYDSHGFKLKDGERRKKILLTMSKELGDPVASNLTAKHYSHWRAKDLKKVTPNTANRKLAYARALFNELHRLGEWAGENPLNGIRQFRIDETELAYLDEQQIAALLRECRNGRNPHTYLVACLCLATGARWSEAEGLTTSQLYPNRVQYVGTKSGKRRTVGIHKEFAKELQQHRRRFALAGDRFFASCYASFGKAIERAGIALPRGQQSHVLRHTFASYFIQHSRRPDSLVTLQKLLGHSDIKLTLKYAHIAPDSLHESVNVNPLGQFWDNSAKVTAIAPKQGSKKGKENKQLNGGPTRTRT